MFALFNSALTDSGNWPGDRASVLSCEKFDVITKVSKEDNKIAQDSNECIHTREMKFLLNPFYASVQLYCKFIAFFKELQCKQVYIG